MPLLSVGTSLGPQSVITHITEPELAYAHYLRCHPTPRSFLLFGGVFSFLAQRPWGRRLLLAYPRLFSNGMFSHGACA